jgi:hypothetical protein
MRTARGKVLVRRKTERFPGQQAAHGANSRHMCYLGISGTGVVYPKLLWTASLSRTMTVPETDPLHRSRCYLDLTDLHRADRDSVLSRAYTVRVVLLGVCLLPAGSADRPPWVRSAPSGWEYVLTDLDTAT